MTSLPARIQVEFATVSRLAHYAFEHLRSADADEGCCRWCCTPCLALAALAASNLLDDLLRHRRAGGQVWWSADDRLDRVALDRAWRRTDCHDVLVITTTDADYYAEVSTGPSGFVATVMDADRPVVVRAASIEGLRQALTIALNPPP